MTKLFAFGIMGITLPFTIFTVSVNPSAVNSGVGSGTSYNWSGYVAPAGTYTSVAGTWTIPTVASASTTEADTAWVGIGGVTGQDLIQAGTQAVTDPSGGVTYEAWYETLPQATQPLSLTVKAGDSVTASVTQISAGEWQILFRDNTTGQNTSLNIPYNSSLSSAEWIQEMPENGNSFVPLDNFGTISFTNGSAVQNGNSVTIAQSGAKALTMVDHNGNTLATTSALGSDGGSFTVTRSAVAVTNTQPGFVVPRGRVWRRTGVGVEGYTPASSTTPTATSTGRGQRQSGRGRSFFYNFSGMQGQISRMWEGMRTEMNSRRF